MPGILLLPVETIHLIAGYLPTDDFFAFRQTCQFIKEITFDQFTRTYFERRYVMLERQSLNTLIRISEHPSLGPKVHTLGLCTERLPEPEYDVDGIQGFWSTLTGDSGSGEFDYWPDGDAGLWPEDDDFLDQSNAIICRRYFDDQESFLSGADVAALTQAMKRLSNCKALVLTDANAPWGAKWLEREAGELDRGLASDDVDDEPFVKHVLDVMLTAAKASNLGLEELRIELGQEDEPMSTEPISFCLLDSPPEHMRQPGNIHLTSITTLKLLVSVVITDVPNENEPVPEWAHNFDRFIGLFPQLSHFSLAFSDVTDFYTISSYLFDMLSIPQLRKLELTLVEATESHLTGFLLRHQSALEEIVFCEMIMEDKSSWITLLGKIKHMPHVHSMTLKDCWFSALDYSRTTCDNYELATVCIKGEGGYEEAIAMVEEVETM